MKFGVLCSLEEFTHKLKELLTKGIVLVILPKLGFSGMVLSQRISPQYGNQYGTQQQITLE